MVPHEVAIGAALESLREEGEAIPAPRHVRVFRGQFRMRFPPSLHARLFARAEREEASLNARAEREEVSLNALVTAIRSQALGAPEDPGAAPSGRGG